MREATQSVCPVCLARLPARRVRRGDEVVLEKRCPTHGDFSAVVWRGLPDWDAWDAPPRPPTHPERPDAVTALGCPFDCGLCPEHRQGTCCVLLEVTQRCNLRCPVCFAAAGGPAPEEPTLASLVASLERLKARGGRVNLQLSGGEPTTRDDLPALLEAARALGFDFLQLNTNGLRLGREAGYARALQAAGVSCVYLQYDACDEAGSRPLRGTRVLPTKEAAVERCREAGLGVVLVATVVPGVNDGQLGALVRHALELGPVVRGVHLQPVSYFGRYPRPPADADRLTLPEVMQALERQTGGLLKASDFRPPSAENAHCSFSATYARTADGGLARAAPAPSCCCAPRPGGEALKARDAVARRWQLPAPAGRGDASPATASLDAFLQQARRDTFSVSGMAFQDAWTLDLERLKECFIHVADAPGLVPFCAYNLTGQDGRSLYRRA